MAETLTETINKYRILIRNSDPDENSVRKQVREEIGNVEVIDWEIEDTIHYKHDMDGTPQRQTVILLNYMGEQRQ